MTYKENEEIYKREQLILDKDQFMEVVSDFVYSSPQQRYFSFKKVAEFFMEAVSD